MRILVIALISLALLVPSAQTVDASAYLMGDVDCNKEVSSLDALGMLQVIAKLGSPDPYCHYLADMNGDQRTTSVDVQLVLQAVAGLWCHPMDACDWQLPR